MQRTEWNPLIQHLGYARQFMAEPSPLIPVYSQWDFDIRTVPAWDCYQVAEWVASIGWGQYSNLFLDHNVNGMGLLTLDIVGMQRMGVGNGRHAMVLERRIRELNQSKRRAVLAIDTLPCMYYRALNLGCDPPPRYYGELVHGCNP